MDFKENSIEQNLTNSNNYNLGFKEDIESEILPPGLNEDVIKKISTIKNEPEWLLNFRLEAYSHLQKIKQPLWSNLKIENFDLQSISYFSRPKNLKNENNKIDEKLIKYYEKLGIPLKEQEYFFGKVAVDAVLDSVSIGTTFKDTLDKLGIIFCSFSEAVKNHPELIKQYLGSVVSYKDNFYACLNSAVFSDGSFCYIPKNTKCPMDLSTYFRINQANIGQFERTLIIAEDNSTVSYLEGCSSVVTNEYQLHAAVVELIAMDNASIKYATVQNWFPGDENGKGGLYNLVTKRGECKGKNSHISWTQIETGSAITWKYPSVILKGDGSKGEFYSVALTNHFQQADTGTKMIHIGKNTTSTIISKSISAGQSTSTYRGLVRISPKSENAKNHTQCDSLIFGNSTVYTEPYIENFRNDCSLEHEATTSNISKQNLFFLQSRGFSEESAKQILVNGFCKSVFQKLPMEFAVEAQKLLELNLEGSIG